MTQRLQLRIQDTGLRRPPTNNAVSPTVLTSLHRPRPTIVYDTYWRFAAERQRIFRARVRGERGPWTNDEVLSVYRFTNAYRAADRTSQFLIRNVIFEGPQTPKNIFFRVMLFKLFNKIETWRLLEAELGTISWQTYSFEKYNRVLGDAFLQGTRIYSAAYIVPSPRRFGYDRKHSNHLRLLESLMRDNYPRKLQESPRMEDAFSLMRSVPSFGDFLAYQYVTDLNYSSLMDFAEGEFVMAGPGAIAGIRKCFRDPEGRKPEDLIRMVTDRQEEEFAQRGLRFDDLWGRPLQLIDCQNLFCEVDKYARAAHPEFTEVGGRYRIKQVFRPSASPSARPWFPPDWCLNERIGRDLGNVDEHGQESRDSRAGRGRGRAKDAVRTLGRIHSHQLHEDMGQGSECQLAFPKGSPGAPR